METHTCPFCGNTEFVPSGEHTNPFLDIGIDNQAEYHDCSICGHRVFILERLMTDEEYELIKADHQNHLNGGSK